MVCVVHTWFKEKYILNVKYCTCLISSPVLCGPVRTGKKIYWELLNNVNRQLFCWSSIDNKKRNEKKKKSKRFLLLLDVMTLGVVYSKLRCCSVLLDDQLITILRIHPASLWMISQDTSRWHLECITFGISVKFTFHAYCLVMSESIGLLMCEFVCLSTTCLTCV